MLRRAITALIAVLFFAASGASAHDELLGYAKIWTEPDAYVLEVNLDPYVTESFLADKLENPGSWLDHVNYEKSRAILTEEGENFFTVESAGQVIEPMGSDFRVEHDNCIYTIRYPRTGAEPLVLTHNFIRRMRPGYRTLLDVVGPDGRVAATIILTADEPRAPVSFAGAAPAESEGEPSPVGQPNETGGAEPKLAPSPSHGWFPTTFFKLGVEHIAFGFDHLLFLAGLLVACRRPFDIFGIVTSFTLAHSITLSVAALGLWMPPPSIVEPAIAASIVYVGVENIIRKDIGTGRAWLTFAFGLIHGFGFAGVLRELGLGQDGKGIVGPLFAFNVGIEAGQLAIVAIVLPALLGLQHASSRARHFLTPALSAVIALLGLFWLLQRTVFAA